MARAKAKDSSLLEQTINYPQFDTLEEQKAFQWGLATAFNATAESQNATAKAIINKGEEILRGMGWNGKMGKEGKR